MKWHKKGRINIDEWSREEAFFSNFTMSPTPILINNEVIRVFLGFCDVNNVGRVGYVDVAAENPSKVLNICKKPVLNIGKKGCFDDNGVIPQSILKYENLLYLYYAGFQLGVNVPYYMFGGLSKSCDNGNTFIRVSEAPVLDRNNEELFARCGIFVMKEHDVFKMWYVGTINEGWTHNGETLKPLYTMRYTESNDGISWNQTSVQCLNFNCDDEHGFSRPYVWKADGCYKMLYSIRTYSRGYYLGYAESDDGINWVRKDELVGIETSAHGWDGKNMSYPYIVDYKGRLYLFYNGNEYGKTGFGYAEMI